jgi:CO/xanthine dehydrogenase Mo-binding subunit
VPLHRLLQDHRCGKEGIRVTIGASLPRADATGKVTGAALYPGDIRRDDFLHAKVVFTDQPHARLLALDVSGALKVPGVVDVVTADDVPVNEYGLTLFDQPVLIGKSARSRIPGDVSRWEADHLAVVVAETQESAQQGALAIRAEWEQLPIVADLDTALTGITLVHPENGLATNAYHHLRIRKGDVKGGWEAADVVIEANYQLPYQEHAYLQPEAAVSYLDDQGRVTVEIAGQWTWEDRQQIAHSLDIAEERIRVIYPEIGGAFGGREDMSLQIVLALATRKLAARGIKRPIRCVWSREESIIGHHKRHRGRVHTSWGATRDGKLVVTETDAYLDAGAYNYTSNKVLGNLHVSVCGPYDIPNARVDSYAVYTNAVPGGAFRGFGAPQGAFVAENQMNKLAEALGIDPIELRLKNCLREGSIGITQAELPPGVSMPEVIEACAWAADRRPDIHPVKPFASLPESSDSIRRGRGFACAYKNVGFSFGFPERCDATVELHGDDEVERVVLYHGGAEVGQGAHAVFRQMVAEATGVAMDRVETRFSDTATSGDSGSASASRSTFMAGNSILGATEEAQKRWIEGARPAIGVFRYIPPPTQVLDADTGAGQPNFAYGYVAESVDLAVDVDTGHIQIERVVCADDVGKAINPMLIEGQLEGAVVQALGYAVLEDLVVSEARVVNHRLSSYLIPGIGDIPGEVESVLLEHPDPRGPWGARGMAEMPFIPLAPAIVAALHDATGVWFDQIPLTPPRVVAELRRHGLGGV